MDEPVTTPAVEKPLRRRRWRRGFLLALFGVGLLLGGAGAALVKSSRGQRMVVESALNRVRGALAGSLTVDAVRSSSLLGGVTLVGVRLDAGGERSFLWADSVRLRYSILGLLAPEARLASTMVWGPRVVISRYAGEDASNVSALLVPAVEPTGLERPVSRQPPAPIRLGTLRLEGGTLEVLSPALDPGPRVPTVPAPDGQGRLRRLALEGVNAEVRSATIAVGTPELFVGDLTYLATDVAVLDQPLRIRGGEGRLVFGEQGLALSEARVRLPSSSLTGSFVLGPRADGTGAEVRLDLETDGPLAFADLDWLDPRIPDGVVRGGMSLTVADGISVRLDRVRGEMEASRFTAHGEVDFGEGLVLREMALGASPVSVKRLEPWLGRQVPLDGWLSGDLVLSGTPEALRTEGSLTLVPIGFGGRVTTVDLRGTIHGGDDPGVSGLEATLDPLRYEVLQAFMPDLRVSGSGRARVEITGSFGQGLRFLADAEHDGPLLRDGRIVAGGSIRKRGDGVWVADIQGDVATLRLGILGGTVPGLAADAVVGGTARAVGPLDELDVSAEFAVGGGTLSLEGTVDAMTPGDRYAVHLASEDVLLSDLFPRLPAPSRWSGELYLDGRGLGPDALAGQATLVASASRIGGLHIDSLATDLTVVDGVMRVDTLVADLGGFEVTGGGALGLSQGAYREAHLAFRTESLLGLRPIFLGDSVIARDELSELDRRLLRFEGVDPDTLPLLADVAMHGALTGRITLTGGLGALDLDGEATLTEGAYGRNRVGGAELRVAVRDLLRESREMDLDVTARGVDVFGRSLDDLEAEITTRGREAGIRVAGTRGDRDRYDVAGDVVLDSAGGQVRVAEAVFQLDSLEWSLARPARVSWDSDRVSVLGLELLRQGEDPMRLAADGFVDWAGNSNFRVDGSGLRIGRLLRLAQLEELDAQGHTDLSMTIVGPAHAPVIEAFVQVDQPRYRDLTLARLSGAISYRDQVATVRLEATDSARLVFDAEGAVPVDLAFDAEGSRVVDAPMDVRVKADSLSARLALSYFGVLEDVAGVVSGDFTIGGTLDAIEPRGVLQLGGASWAIESMGVRHGDVKGTLTLNPDRVVDVALSSRAVGTSQVSGSVTLDPLLDPGLDLVVDFFGFEALNRRDLAGRISGQLHLGGRYRQPLVEGALRVDQGTILLEEFARSATVVDLTDPRIFDVVDTTALSGRALLAGVQNPFLSNLRMDVGLAVPRDTWLRSPDMNVEIGGDLQVSYDRVDRDLVMVGELEALRGSYQLLGRRFDVQGGTVGFIGTPGINPTLAIEALSVIRRIQGDPLSVSATVEGTLIAPRVALSTSEQGVAESDLVSYLVFGRPSHELATGQEALFGGGSLAGAATGFGVTYLSGTLASQLGAAVAQQIGVDYLSISQAGDFGLLSGTGLSSSFAGTQIEIGQYVGDDVFFVLIFRPLSDETTRFFGGARLEVALNYDLNLQGFWEDRFLRSRVGGFDDLGLQASQVLGVFVFREWGY